MRKMLCGAAVILFCSSIAQAQQQGRVLHHFSGSDGAGPEAKLVFDKAGNLYGTTYSGGANDYGTVFELSPNQNGSWSETVLYSFCQDLSNSKCLDGAQPVNGLVIDRAGNLYGVTPSGGTEPCPWQTAGCGIIFEVSPPSSAGEPWTYSVLYNFCNDYQEDCPDGAEPRGDLVFDQAGNLYGTTWVGGAHVEGTVFELARAGSGWTESVLYSFCSVGSDPACLDGLNPVQGVTFDGAGNLFGATPAGGIPNSQGGGVIYKLSLSSAGWSQTVVHAFAVGGLFPPIQPLGTVQLYHDYLYSTNLAGGTFDQGGVFELNLEGRGHEIASFNGTDGANPAAGVLVDHNNGDIYGTTSADYSAVTAGTVFKISSGQLTVLWTFNPDGAAGAYPYASLIADKHGHLYGTTVSGGKNDEGVVFEITP